MKKIYLAGAILATTISFGQQTLPFTDAFNYPAGNLHDTAPWEALGFPNAGGDHILLDGSKVIFAGIGTDAQIKVTPQSSGTVFYKFSLKVVSMAGVTQANGGYLAGFATNAITHGGTLWTKRVDDNTFKFGIETATATGVDTTWDTADYSTGTTYTVVVAYTFGTGTSDDITSLWVNPTGADEASPLLTDYHTGTDLAYIESFFLRQDSVQETPSVEIDNVKVSNSFTEVLANTKFNAIAGLKIFPNPVTDGKLFISSDTGTTKTIAIYNALGKQVLNTTIENGYVNTSNLSTGVYMVKITEEGKTATRKLVIK
ncbi:T9SS type A sorting domain-containing protein [Flavobacterium sp. SM15]|uniref:T9SS type A sorting domain-containing protein n=1 Tax=Flavobacterium sp. SM15 TaxID=2908005 RepID=UPI001EDA9189|nr:T9SS type A sorting domain-containing protein [Flavobacterium sp. SM15]MCG2610094.1 T9SS type A sorting domain-containing protein [Flavobacterium sp. SM15]